MYPSQSRRPSHIEGRWHRRRLATLEVVGRYLTQARAFADLGTISLFEILNRTLNIRPCVILRVTRQRYSEVLRGTHRYSIRTAQRSDLRFRFAFARRRSGFEPLSAHGLSQVSS